MLLLLSLLFLQIFVFVGRGDKVVMEGDKAVTGGSSSPPPG